jgi:hypothetical protein
MAGAFRGSSSYRGPPRRVLHYFLSRPRCTVIALRAALKRLPKDSARESVALVPMPTQVQRSDGGPVTNSP